MTPTIALLAVTALVCVLAGREFLSMRATDAVFPSPGLTAARALSDYFPALKGTPGDTPVYVFSGPKAGGNILITGGAHPNEPAGYITSIVLAETIRVGRGTVIIIPWANASGFTHSDPQEGSPQRFPIDTLKIDRSFVQHLPNNPDNNAIATAIVTLAHALQMSVVAEGVETAEQQNYLASIACESMQGYLFSKPIPAEEFAALLAKNTAEVAVA